jgi:hypothetical protein
MLHLVGSTFQFDEATTDSCLLEQLHDLHIGQSHDLHWTRHASCPTEEEYLDMVAKSKSSYPTQGGKWVLIPRIETGGLFRLLSRLMCSHLDTE